MAKFKDTFEFKKYQKDLERAHDEGYAEGNTDAKLKYPQIEKQARQEGFEIGANEQFNAGCKHVIWEEKIKQAKKETAKEILKEWKCDWVRSRSLECKEAGEQYPELNRFPMCMRCKMKMRFGV